MNAIVRIDPARAAILGERLAALRQRAPGGALLSITLDLGTTPTDWLDRAPRTADYCYWARPTRAGYCLGLGRAVACTSAGPARLTALQAAYDGMVREWLHDGDDGCSEPVACLGFAFDDDGGAPLPSAQIWVPAVLLRRHGERSTATFTTAARDSADAPMHWLALLDAVAEGGATEVHAPETTGGSGSPLAQRAWAARVDAALAAIAAGEIDKVVLSRTRRLTLPTPPSPVRLLRTLTQLQPESTTYAIGTPSATFLGATPERLVSRRGVTVRADALAGTAWSDTPLDVGKNAHEQALVVRAIREALAPLCAALDVPEAPQVLELRHLRHLFSPIRGQLRDGVTLFDLIAALHPTPAVGGWPIVRACDWLRHHHERRRGWYTGGIGWIDRGGDGELAVGLRSALIEGRNVELAAGAGIVAGSSAALEFDETEAKLATMLRALQTGSDADRRTGTR